MHNTQPIFIVSSGRSGSKAVADLLNGKPQVEMHHEYLCETVQQLAVSYQMKLLDRSTVTKELAKLYLPAVALCEKPYFGDCSNKLSWVIEPLAELFPNAKFVYLVRDGRKVVSSYFHKLSAECYDDHSVAALRNWLGGNREFPQPPPEKKYWWPQPLPGDADAARFEGFTQFERIAYHYALNHQVIDRTLAGVEPGRKRLVKLESLMADAAAVEALLNFLGLDYTPADAAFFERPRNVNKPVDTPLNPEQDRQFWAIAGDAMRALDYAENEVYSVCYHPESAEACGLCGHTPLSTVYEVPGSARGLRVAVCPLCELMQSLPRHLKGDRKQRLSGGADWGNIRYGKQFALGPALAMIQANAQPAGFGRVLDVGSSRGDFVAAMLSLAPQAAITAVEPDTRLTDSYRHTPGVTLLEQPIETLKLAPDTYDFMYLSHTLEHLQEPLAVLRQLNRALTAAGMIYIEVPDVAFLRSKQLVEEWFIDKHPFHFSEATLRTLVTLAGLRVVALETTPQDGVIRTLVKSAGHFQSDHGFDQGSGVGQLLRTYVRNTTANKQLLRKAAQHIHSLARQRPAVIWGGGRLLDLLVKEGELSPSAFDALIDVGFIGKIESVHGLAVCHPDHLPVGEPAFVLIASRAFEAEIRAQVLQRWPGAAIASLMGLLDQVEEHPLAAVARRIRVDTIAQIYLARSGHPGGALSVVDILTTLAAGPLEWRRGFRGADLNRARLVLSKGHACPALYAVAARFGLIEAGQLASLRKLEGPLQGHPHAGSTPFVEVSTGSLGQGFSAAIGMALGLRHQGSQAPVFAVLGDGELQEGEVWEGAMCAAHHRLNRLCAILDYNRMQSDDTNRNVMGIEPVADKWRAFGWQVLEVDGHDFAQLEEAYAAFAAVVGRPTLIVAHTRKGKGVSYMENSPAWHGSATLSDEQFETAMRDLLVSREDTERLRHGRF